MGTILGRLGYNFEDEGNTRVINFSSGANGALNNAPRLLADWQYEDLKEANVGGYYKNPVANITNSIITLSNSMVGLALTISSGGFTDVIDTANSIALFVAPQFRDHTYRVSGVVSVSDDELAELPHYDTAMARGRALTYLANQSDNVTNSAAIMGSFTSIIIEDDLNDFYNIANTEYYIVLNSLSDDGMGGNTSNLTSGQILNVKNAFVTINTTFETRRTHDENFYTNAGTVLDDFNQVRAFSQLGETQNNLLINYVASDKLLQRIDSANT